MLFPVLVITDHASQADWITMSTLGVGGGGWEQYCVKNDLMPVISCLTSLTFWS